MLPQCGGGEQLWAGRKDSPPAFAGMVGISFFYGIWLESSDYSLEVSAFQNDPFMVFG